MCATSSTPDHAPAPRPPGPIIAPWLAIRTATSTPVIASTRKAIPLTRPIEIRRGLESPPAPRNPVANFAMPVDARAPVIHRMIVEMADVTGTLASPKTVGRSSSSRGTSCSNQGPTTATTNQPTTRTGNTARNRPSRSVGVPRRSRRAQGNANVTTPTMRRTPVTAQIHASMSILGRLSAGSTSWFGPTVGGSTRTTWRRTRAASALADAVPMMSPLIR